jgi:UPF0755 protein
MRPRVRGWAVAAAAVPALAATLLLAIGGEEAGRRDGVAEVEPTAAETSRFEASAPDSAPVTTASPLSPTTSTGAPTATTTEPPEPTTTQPVAPSASAEYTPVPKPGAGPGTIAPGGALTKQLVADIATAFGYPVSDVEAAIADVELPPEASGNPEGWLAPGTYHLDDEGTALDVVQAMVDRRVAQLSERAIPRDQWHRVVTAASVIEKETYNQNEKPGVARVLTNRLAGGGPLQMDSIILYPISEDRIFTTSEERASDQPYNSYRHNGLPPTPICSPDEESIDAFLAPPPGDWWFYVTIDLHSGETRYAVTYEEHLANVELLRAWLRANPTP